MTEWTGQRAEVLPRRQSMPEDGCRHADCLPNEMNRSHAPDRWRTSSADRTTVICRPAGRTVSALILPTRWRGSRKSDAEKNVVFLPRTKVLTKFITENFVYVYDVRRRCDCLASSAPFTNIQTYLLTYLMWYKKTDVQLSSYIPHGRGRKS